MCLRSRSGFGALPLLYSRDRLSLLWKLLRYDSVLRNCLFRWRIAIFDRRNECWSQLHFITIVTVRHFPTNISARLPIVSVRPECTASYAPPDSHAVQHLNGRVIASLMAVWAECHVTSCNSVFQLVFELIVARAQLPQSMHVTRI